MVKEYELHLSDAYKKVLLTTDKWSGEVTAESLKRLSKQTPLFIVTPPEANIYISRCAAPQQQNKKLSISLLQQRR